MDHVGRLRRLWSDVEREDLDALLVTHLPNVHYLCGFTGSAAALLLTNRGSILFTDGRYRTQARGRSGWPGCEEVRPHYPLASNRSR
jgi:Xaa-Pro aminopeptidase